MKKLILSVGILFSGVLSAQIYTPSGTVGTSSNGNVGIGTATPNEKLELSDGFITSRINQGAISPTNKSGFKINQLGIDVFELSFARDGLGEIKMKTPFDNPMVFGTNDIERMRITPNGNIGIGTINPIAPFEIYKQNSNNQNLVISQFTGDGATGGSNMIRLRYHNNVNLELNSGYTGVNFRYGTYSDFNIENEALGGVHGGINFITNQQVRMNMSPSGKIGMGTNNFSCSDCSDYRLFVKDGIRTEQVKVDVAANNGWADYVFKKDYQLKPLKEVESFIKENGHLPEVPSEKQAIENGVELKAMNILLLKKIEELTLYTIDQQKRIEALESQMKSSK